MQEVMRASLNPIHRMDSIMYSPNDHNTAFACCGEKFLFKKPLNYSHTTFLTLCLDKFKLELTDTNLVNF